ncbi:hypothetical protein ACIOJF_02475 [Glutamicibacter sp. NPDC087831]|uniref:hypothetical protein n=1 Tax=Glutamicibacter sp. NPDC087831 TaxID=3363998 RepID=UPI00382FFBCF
MIQLFFKAVDVTTPTAEQAANSSPDLFWTIIASAFGGALLTSAVTLFTKWRDSKNEHKKWLKDQKLKAYSDLQAIFIQSRTHDPIAGKSSEVQNDFIDNYFALNSHMKLLAPDSINVALRELVQVFNLRQDPEKAHIYDSHLTKVTNNMRKDLGVK